MDDRVKYVRDNIVEYFSPIGDVCVTRDRDLIRATFSLCPSVSIKFAIPFVFSGGQFNITYWILLTFSGEMTPTALKKIFFSLQKFPVSLEMLMKAFEGILKGPSVENRRDIYTLLTSLDNYQFMLDSFKKNGFESTQVAKNTVVAMNRMRQKLHYHQVDQYERDMKYFTLLDATSNNIEFCRNMRNDLLLPLNNAEFLKVEKRLCYYLEHHNPSFRNVLTRLYLEEGFFIYQFICHFELLPEISNHIIWLVMLLHVFCSNK